VVNKVAQNALACGLDEKTTYRYSWGDFAVPLREGWSKNLKRWETCVVGGGSLFLYRFDTHISFSFKHCLKKNPKMIQVLWFASVLENKLEILVWVVFFLTSSLNWTYLKRFF